MKLSLVFAGVLFCGAQLSHSAGGAAASAPSGAAMAQATGTRARFAELSEQFIHQTLALSPSQASQAGYHQHLDPKTGKAVALDALLDDVSAAGVNSGSLWEVGSDGSGLHPLLPAWHSPPVELGGRWTPDGRYYLFTSGTDIWALREGGGLFQKRDPIPVRLTTGPLTFSNPVPSQDGKKLFVKRKNLRGAPCPSGGQLVLSMGQDLFQMTSHNRSADRFYGFHLQPIAFRCKAR